MDVSEAKHQARLAEWRIRVAECRSSGKSVRTWCAEQGVGYKTYYRWEREILQVASKELILTSHEEKATPVFAELPSPASVSEKTIIAARVDACDLSHTLYKMLRYCYCVGALYGV